MNNNTKEKLILSLKAKLDGSFLHYTNTFNSDFKPNQSSIGNKETNWSFKINKVGIPNSINLFGNNQDADKFLKWIANKYDIRIESLLPNAAYVLNVPINEQVIKVQYEIKVSCDYGSEFDGTICTFLLFSEEDLIDLLHVLVEV